MLFKNIKLPKTENDKLSNVKLLRGKYLKELVDNSIFFQKIIQKFELNLDDLRIHLVKDIPFTKHTCKTCGKIIHGSLKSYTFADFCSNKCLNKDPAHIRHIKDTCLKKYGCVATSQLNFVKEKIKQTNLNKFGVLYPMQSLLVQEKLKENNQKKYGVDYVTQLESVKSQIQDTNLKKYGVKSILSLASVHNIANIQNRNKAYEKLIKRCVHEEVEPLFSKEEYSRIGKKLGLMWKCKKCGNEFFSAFNNAYLPICHKCHPLKYTKSHEALVDFLKSLNPSLDLKINDRTQIRPLELDIYIPSLKLAIEFNGDYWHSEANGVDKNYHLNKTKLCEEKGIHLIHIFEHDWVFNKNQVESRLCSLLNIYDKKIFARKCIVREIDFKTASDFISQYHLQGSCSSSYNIGLFYNNELISVMTFGKPRFNKKYEWELLRFCSIPKFKIIGGAGKLLKFFEQTYNPTSLISYANRCWSSKLSNVYEKIGFKLVGESKPSYVYCAKNKLISRYKAQKHKLKALLGEDKFKAEKSEVENMSNNGYFRLFDCGNLIFEKRFNSSRV